MADSAYAAVGSVEVEASPPTSTGVSVPTTTVRPLFRSLDAVGGRVLNGFSRSASMFFGSDLDSRKIVAKKVVFEEEGCPAISFSDEEISKLSTPFTTTLVGKFYNGVPSISEISKALKGQNLKGTFSASFINAKSVIIRLLNVEDFDYLWMKQCVSVEKCQMRVVKWTPTFNTAIDSPVVPVWISLRHVPIMLFHPEALFELVRPFGKPLKVASATASFTRLEKARVLVELDISKVMSEAIFAEFRGQKVKIKVSHDCLLLYCDFCSKIGHRADNCFIKNPQVKSVSNLNQRCASSDELRTKHDSSIRNAQKDVLSEEDRINSNSNWDGRQDDDLEGERNDRNSNWQVPSKTFRSVCRQEVERDSGPEKVKNNFSVLENLEVQEKDLESPPVDMEDVSDTVIEHLLVASSTHVAFASASPEFFSLALEKLGVSSSVPNVLVEQVAPFFGQVAESLVPPPQPPEKKKGRTTKNSIKKNSIKASYSSSLPMMKAVLRKSRRYSPKKLNEDRVYKIGLLALV